MAETQRDIERHRATAASVVQELNASQTPAQHMTERLRAAAAAQTASAQHSRAHQVPVDFAEWTINHEDEIKSYMEQNPGVSHTDAARDVYMTMTGSPLPRRSGTSSSSTDTPPEQSTPSTEIRKKPAPSEAKRQRRVGPTLNEKPMNPRQLFPKKMPPLPEGRINWGRGREGRTMDRPKPHDRRRSRSPKRKQGGAQVGPTQRRFQRNRDKDI